MGRFLPGRRRKQTWTAPASANRHNSRGRVKILDRAAIEARSCECYGIVMFLPHLNQGVQAMMAFMQTPMSGASAAGNHDAMIRRLFTVAMVHRLGRREFLLRFSRKTFEDQARLAPFAACPRLAAHLNGQK
jgi:hypothetical protein